MTASNIVERVAVDIAGRGYDILVGPGLIERAGAEIRERFGARRLVVVTDENLARCHLPALQASLDAAGLRHDTVVLPAGEKTKDIHRFPDFLEKLLDFGLERKSMLVALGGGVIGDLTGFAAASLLRGMDFVQIPTSLLAQIDSSVGGKTGVNTRQGKNLVGAFHQPRLVLADLGALRTLPPREFRAGYAEMVKYGLLGDAEFFAHLERLRGLETADRPVLAAAIAHCCRMKAEIVAEDEREAGRRALLNLGHTFGHALEAETGFGDGLLHGESVAIGMVMAANLSVKLGRSASGDLARIWAHLTETGLPVSLDGLPGAPFTIDRLMAHMGHDKKVVDGKVAFIVMNGIGRAELVKDVTPETVRSVLAEFGAI
ncbi:MAG TPA: 3-dehydroquinate synthase [Stellaceae bacterium]|jgi:3-dehydroquinate synthase|nr:3-dehydroquinate synthase [Stellaceae bacterium]